MKKILTFLLLAVFGLTLSGCTLGEIEELNATLSSQESLAILSYVSGSFLDTKTESPSASAFAFLSDTDEPVVGDEIDDINVYVDRLKVFIENGTEGFGDVQLGISDREDYDFMMSVEIEDDSYLIYYSVSDTDGVTGIIVVGESEYTIEVLENNYNESNDLIPEQAQVNRNNAEDDEDEADTEDDEDEADTEDDEDEADTEDDEDEADTEDDEDEADTEDDEDEADTEDDEDEADIEDDEDEEESETKMVLIASDGENTIRVAYKNEVEDDESKTVISITKTINGVESFSKMTIKQEDDETKLIIEEDGDEYVFKAEVEDDGEMEYKLTYRVDGVEGRVMIKASYDEFGELVYEYHITEGGHEYTEQRGKPEWAGRPENPGNGPKNDSEETETDEETESIPEGDTTA
jgi:hypothetical protein